MWDLCRVSKPVARKTYDCDAMVWIEESLVYGDDGETLIVEGATEEEMGQIRQAQTEGNKILPGTKYVKCTGVFDGEWSTFRARPEINAICDRLEFWEYI